MSNVNYTPPSWSNFEYLYPGDFMNEESEDVCFMIPLSRDETGNLSYVTFPFGAAEDDVLVAEINPAGLFSEITDLLNEK